MNRELLTIGRTTEMVTAHIGPHWTFSLLLHKVTHYKSESKGVESERKREANIFETLVMTFTDADELSLELST